MLCTAVCVYYLVYHLFIAVSRSGLVRSIVNSDQLVSLCTNKSPPDPKRTQLSDVKLKAKVMSLHEVVTWY